MLHKAGSCKRCCKMPAIANCVARIVSLGRQLQAMFHWAGSCKLCLGGQAVTSIVAQAKQFKQCCAGQAVASKVPNGRLLQTMFHRADSGRQCRERQLKAMFWTDRFQAMLLRVDILVAESRQLQAMLHTDAISCKQYFVGQTVASNVLQCRLL